MQNNAAIAPSPHPPWMEEIASLVNEITGVKLGSRQSAMLEARLRRRMNQLGYKDPLDYVNYLRNNMVSEVPKLVTLLTTHHTFFFRESVHFQFLEEKGLSPIVAALRALGEKTLKVWSAACSQGQEAYSLAMLLSHHLKTLAPEIRIEIVASDVDPDSIAKAQNGVYRWEELKAVPLPYLYNNWLRGTGEISDFAKAKSSIKSLCRFEVANLLDLATKPSHDAFDIIFCRNVFIYFENDRIRTISESLLRRLKPHGLLFVGLSESLIATGLPVASIAPSVYAHKGSIHWSARDAVGSVPPIKGEGTASSAARKYRIFCVDDSPTILALLQKILEPEFEIIGTAANGLEASQKLKTLRPDLVTLDIHMPEQGGIEYLEKNLSPVHPPVIILSSVPREDSDQAMRCLHLGALDYIEKPDLPDMDARADEIRTKIRCAIQNFGAFSPGVTDLERSFHQQVAIAFPERKLRLIFAGAAERAKFGYILRECKGTQPPTLILMEGSRGLLPSLLKSIADFSKLKCELVGETVPSLENGVIYLGDFRTAIEGVLTQARDRRVSVLLLGVPTEVMIRSVGKLPDCEAILEDRGTGMANELRAQFRPSYFVPYTSMGYHSNKYLSQDASMAEPVPGAVTSLPKSDK